MGNSQFYASARRFRKEGETIDPQIRSKILFSDDLDLLSEIWSHVKDSLQFDDLANEETALPSNVQLNEDDGNELNLTNAEKCLEQINARFMCGFKTPESHIQDLAEPLHQKYFTVLQDQENQTKMKELQLKKTKILYGLYLMKKKSGQIKTKSFQDFVTQFLAAYSDSPGSRAGLQGGLGFIMVVLQQMKGMGDLLEKSLENLVISLKQCEPKELYEKDRLAISLDASINNGRAFLLDLIKNGTTTQASLSYKILLLIGLARANVEDLLLVCFLLSEETRDGIDLREEILVLKKHYDKQTKAAKKEEEYDPGEFQTILEDPCEMRVCSSGSSRLECNFEKDTWIVDGDFIYLLNEEKGLFKLSGGANGQMSGMIEAFNPDLAKSDASMMLFDDKLYIRYRDLAPAPFIIVDKQTLKEIKPETEVKYEPKEGDHHCIKWEEKNEKTGRSLTYTPLITDGQFLYVIVQQFLSEAELESEEFQGEEITPDLVVEIFDSQKNFEFVNKVLLYKNKQKDKYKKRSNSIEWLKKTQWATNGSQLLLFTEGHKMKFFDLETGIKTFKMEYDFEEHGFSYYNVRENYFYSIFKSDILKMECWKLENFKPRAVTGKYERLLLNQKQDQLLSKEKQEATDGILANIDQLNVIDQLMRGITFSDISEELKKRKWPSQLDQKESNRVEVSIILRFTSYFYKDFSTHLDSVKGVEREKGSVMETFRYPFVTYLTKTTFQTLSGLLEKQDDWITNERTADEMDYENQLSLMKIFNANMQALNYCQINLSNLVTDEAHYQKLLAHIQTGHIKKFAGLTEESMSKYSEAEKELWNQIKVLCQSVIDASIKVVNKGPQEILQNLYALLNKGESKTSHSQIQYLSETPQIRILLGTDVAAAESKLSQIIDVFKKVSTLESELIQNQLKAYKVDEDCSKVNPPLNEVKLQRACEEFLVSYSEEILSRYSAKSEEYSRRLKDSKKKAQIKPDAEQVKLAKAICDISEVVFKEYSDCLNLFVTEIEQSVIAKKEDSDWEGFGEKFKKYEEVVVNILQQHKSFTLISNTYISSLSLFNQPDSDWSQQLIQGSQKVLSVCTRYYNLWNKYGEKFDIGTDIEGPDTSQVLDKTFRNVIGRLHQHQSWHIGMMAFKLIKKESKPKQKEEKEEESEELKKKKKVEKYREQLLENISKSNLLSGGIEVKHLKNFSVETKDQLRAMANLMQDKEMLKNLNLEEERSLDHKDCDDCDILEAIIKEGLNEDTEKLIQALHTIQKTGLKSEDANYKADIGMAMASGANGMKLTRAAFSIMIKFSDLTDDFQTMQDLVAMADDQKEIKDSIAHAIHAQEILNCWKSASQMRSWLQERKTQRSDKWASRLTEKAIKKKQEDAEKGDDEAEKKPEEKDEKKEDDKKDSDEKTEEKNEEKDNQIDSSAKPADEKKEEQKKEEDKKEEDKKEEENEENKYLLTPDEKAKVENEAFDKSMEDLDLIVKKIIVKATFMIKLNIPGKFKKTDTTMQSTGLQIIKAPSQYKDAPPPKLEWQKRLKQWKQMQTKEGAITSLTEQKKEIWGSGMTAVQALLQAPLEVQKIQDNVEQIYLNASRRCAGFKIISDMLAGEIPFSHLENTVSWFASALRMNEKGKKISHYLDDLTGQGVHLEQASGRNFFKIIKSLVDRLKKCKDEKQIKVLLNALKWTYTARDHKDLVQLGFFSTLHKGSNEKDNLLKKAWGRKLKMSSDNIDEQELNHDVIDTFEQLFITITGRVIQKDGEDKIVQRQGKSSMPKLQKARSLVDEDVSEVLLGQAFEIMFKEFERYTSIMLSFQGIDWSTFVRKRNMDRYDQGDDLAELKNEDNILLDEHEEEDDKEEENEEKDKQEEETKPDEEKTEEDKKEEEQTGENKEGEESKPQESELDEEAKKKKEEEEQKKKDEEEQKLREEVVEATKKREEQEFKKLTQLYSENFLFRLLKLIELFTNIAKCSEKPLAMVQRVANPYHMSTLLNLFLLSSPQIKIVVLQIIEHILTIKIPFEVFEEAVQLHIRNPSSLLNKFLNKAQPKVQFEKSNFLQFLYNYLFTNRSKMWTSQDADSDGQYAVTLTISNLLRNMNSMEGSVWAEKIQAEITKSLMTIETFSVQEMDVLMSLIPGGEYGGMTSGQPAVTNKNETVTILGYSSSWKPTSELLKSNEDKEHYDKILKKLSITPEFVDAKQKALSLFYDTNQKDRQDLMFLSPSSLSPISHLDHQKCKQIAKQSPLMKPEVVKHLLKVLKSSNEQSSSSSQKVINDLRQSSILKIITHQIEDLGEEYVSLMAKEDIFKELIKFLFNDLDQKDQSKATSNQVLPLKWLEAKIQRIRKIAIETGRSLCIQSDDVKAYLLDEKELLFKVTDSQTMNVMRTNVYLCAAFNLHKASPDTVFQTVLESDLNIGGANQESVMKYGLVCMRYEQFSKLEPRTLQIMNQSEAILLDLPEKADIETLFKQIVDIYKKDQELSKKKRKGYDNILETIVFFIEKDDFPDFKMKLEQLDSGSNQIDSSDVTTKGPLGLLLKDLKQWGGLDEDEAIYNIDPEKIGDLGEVMSQIQEGIVKTQQEETKFKEALKNAKQSNNEAEIKRIQAAEDTRIAKRKEVIAEKKLKIQEAQKHLEQADEEKSSLESKEIQVYDEYIKDASWWKSLEKVLNEKISVRPNYDHRESEQKQKTDEQMTKILWQQITTLQEDDLQGEHQKAMAQLLSIQKKMCLQDIIVKSNINEIMPILNADDSSKKNFAKFLKIQFNSSIIQMLQIGQKQNYKDLKKSMKEIFEFCLNNEKYSDFFRYFFDREVIASGILSVKDFNQTSAKSVIEYFNIEERAIKMLNPYLMRFFTKLLIKMKSKLFVQIQNSLTNLMNLHLLMVIQFFGQNDLTKKLLKSILYLLNYCQQNVEEFAKQKQLTGVIQNKLLNQATKSISFSPDSDKKFTDVQLYLLEIHLQIDDLCMKVNKIPGEKIGKLLEDSIAISQLKSQKTVLKQSDQFDLLLYKHHLKTVSKDEQDKLKVQVESNKPIFEATTRCLLNIPEVQRMTIKLKDSTKLKPLCFYGISSDPEQEVQLKLGKDREIEWSSGTVYFTYPLRKACIVGFGSSNNNQLSECLDDSFSKPAICKLDDSVPKDFKPTKVWTQHSYTCVMGEKGELIDCGSFGNYSGPSVFKPVSELKKKVKHVTLSNYTMWVILEDDTIWFKGSSSRNSLPGDNSVSSFTQYKLWEGKSEEECHKIIDIVASSSTIFFLSDDGKLFQRGKDIFQTENDDIREIAEIKIPAGTLAKRIWCQCWGDDSNVLYVELEQTDTKKKFIYSAGESSCGLLGQFEKDGNKINKSQTLEKLHMDSKDTTFVDIQSYRYTAIAIDDKGKLWGWGRNYEYMLGIPDNDHDDGLYKPTELQALNSLGMKAKKVTSSLNHTLVLFEDEKGSQFLYSLGITNAKSLGITDDQLGDSAQAKKRPFREITTFTDQKVLDFGCHEYSSIVVIDGVTGDPNEQLHKHQLPNGTKCQGLLHVYKKEGKLIYVPWQEYEARKGELPDVCMAFRCPIDAMEEKEWPDMHALASDLLDGSVSTIEHKEKDSTTQEPIKGPLYQSKCQINHEELEVNHSEAQIALDDKYSIHPLIFYRLAKPLKKEKELPQIDLQKFYKQDSSSQIEIELIPNLSFQKNTQLIKNTQEQWDEVVDNVKKFKKEFSKELIEQVDKQVKQKINESDISSLDIDKALKIAEMEFKEKDLQKLPEKVKKQQAIMFWALNVVCYEVLSYRCGALRNLPDSFDQLITKNKSTMLPCVKNKIIQKEIARLPRGSKHTIKIKRNAASRFVDSGKCDHTGQYTIFGQIYRLCKKNKDLLECFKQNSTDDQMWEVNFAGEGSQDVGGPFREMLTNVVCELESHALPLLIKTVNNRMDHGFYREAWTLNPDATSPTHQELFKFMGRFLGFNLRTGSAMDWHFTPIFWKQLLDEPIVIKDLDGFDQYTLTAFKDLEQLAQKYKPEKFDAHIKETFTTILSNQKTVELCPGGELKKVTHQNYKEYIALTMKARMNEAEKQMNWVKEGIKEVIDLNILTFLNWDEIEKRACGGTIETDVLKSISEYRECSEDQNIIKWFWKMFDAFTQDERKAYLKFVWGRSKIPVDTSNLYYKHRITLYTDWADNALPKAHTCFFMIDIPNYKNYETMESKIKYAIETCGEIDDDYSASSIRDEDDDAENGGGYDSDY